MNTKKYSQRRRTDFLAPVVNMLIDRRIEKNLSQEELNYRIGIADYQLAKWESGHRTPSVFSLHCWADALDARIEIVANDNKPPQTPNEGALAVNDNKFKMVA